MSRPPLLCEEGNVAQFQFIHTFIDRCYSTDLEQQLHGHLQLPRIEHRSGSTEKRIRNRRPGRGATADLNCLDRAASRVLVLAGLLTATTEVVSAVDANDLVHI